MEEREKNVKGSARRDRIVPDWLGWLAVAVALALAAAALYFADV